jgi:hypothetical protein
MGSGEGQEDIFSQKGSIAKEDADDGDKQQGPVDLQNFTASSLELNVEGSRAQEASREVSGTLETNSRRASYAMEASEGAERCVLVHGGMPIDAAGTEGVAESMQAEGAVTVPRDVTHKIDIGGNGALEA